MIRRHSSWRCGPNPNDNEGFRNNARARDDLAGIWNYPAVHWDVDQADRYITMIVRTCGDLADGTLHGRPLTFLREGYFRYPVGSHVFYGFTAEGLDLVRVLHREMDATRHLPE